MSAYTDLVATFSPVAEYRLGEPSGTFANTGSGGLAALADIATVGRGSTAIDVDGDGGITSDGTDRAALSSQTTYSTAALSTNSLGTVILWITTPSSFSTFDHIVSQWSNNVSANHGISFGLDASGNPYYFVRTNGSGNSLLVTADAALSVSTAYMLGFACDGTNNAAIYVNGSAVATTETSKTGTSASGDWFQEAVSVGTAGWVAIGGRRYGTTPTDDSGFVGPIDEVSVFDTELSAANMSSLYAQRLVSASVARNSGAPVGFSQRGDMGILMPARR
jgi:hypothetical protein